MAETRSIQIDQYGKLELTVAVLKDGAAMPLSGWKAKMQIRSKKTSEVVLAEYTTENGFISISGVLGQVHIDVPGTKTAELTVTSGTYDLYVFDPANPTYPHRVLEGNVLISLSTTRPVGE